MASAIEASIFFFLCDPPGSHICETVDPTLLLFSLPSLFSFFPFFQRIFWRVRLLIKSKGKLERGEYEVVAPFRRCGIDFPQRLKTPPTCTAAENEVFRAKNILHFPAHEKRKKRAEEKKKKQICMLLYLSALR